MKTIAVFCIFISLMSSCSRELRFDEGLEDEEIFNTREECETINYEKNIEIVRGIEVIYTLQTYDVSCR